ncbi:bifunctional diguanylate cyclase/phosphodiesterase, partial [Deinococcus sp.]|uniref:putative bifunctional diguanylate cyclase/phosphodiesterase n=1 Tax=Deinococcus sp. TaxID=47478 RepID=UPI002869A761
QRSSEPLAVMFLDLDHFKKVNDSLGHRVGDALLVALSHRLRETVRDPDTVSRLGGDEFVLVLPTTDAAGAAHLAEKLLRCVGQPFQIESHELTVTPSLGIAMFPADGADFDALCKCADAAMYQAKRQQLFSHVFEPATHSGIQALTLETAMRQALPRREFRLVYQPQVSSITGELYGAEALLRWTNPTLGEVTPDQFIPVAELTGLMGQLGTWVLRTACLEAARWTGDHLTISVNVSSTQLRDTHFVDHIHVALRDSGLNPHRLVLEVTETGLIDNPASAHAMLQTLRDEGIRISIDDFGTGYSTLHSLRTLPVDELKIDRAFIQDIGESSQEGWESRSIMRATLQLAHALDLAVVAEGVELQAQADALREVGCDLHQGWLIAPGLDAQEFERFVHDWPARLAASASTGLQNHAPSP